MAEDRRKAEGDEFDELVAELGIAQRSPREGHTVVVIQPPTLVLRPLDLLGLEILQQFESLTTLKPERVDGPDRYYPTTTEAGALWVVGNVLDVLGGDLDVDWQVHLEMRDPRS